MAFSNASLGAEHALAHSLGGHFDMRHGVIHPILLTAVMRYNLDSAEAKLADIGQVILDRKLGSIRETALAGIEKLEEFFGSFNVPQTLREVIEEKDKHFLEPICQMAVNDACNLTNPRPTSWRELMNICKEVW
jgi:alcohol dehydrogenase